MVMTPEGLNPGFTERKRENPFMRRPAPISSIRANATSVVTRILRMRWPAALAVLLRPPSLRAAATSVRAASNAGAMPKMTPVNIETARANRRTRKSSRDQQVRKIRAGDQQNQSHRSEEYEQRRTHISDKRLAERSQLHFPFLFHGRKLLRERIVNCGYVRLGLLKRDTPLQPPVGMQEMHVAIHSSFRVCDPEGNEYVGMLPGGNKSFRHHTDYGVGVSTEQNRFAYGVWIAA